MKEFYSRQWLNQKKGTAFITASASQALPTWVEADFEIADCHRKASIDLSFCSPKDKKEKLKKLDIAISTLQALRSAMVEMEAKK
jgi:hypothetical protein